MFNDVEPEGYTPPHFTLAEPTVQEKASKDKRDATLEQLPLLKEVVTRLDKRIALTDSVKEAMKLAEASQITREEALIVLETVRVQLEAERTFILGRLDSL